MFEFSSSGNVEICENKPFLTFQSCGFSSQTDHTDSDEHISFLPVEFEAFSILILQAAKILYFTEVKSTSLIVLSFLLPCK